MKKLTCETCGSSDIIKQDGVFVCQGCGMKYSAEEIKKMLGTEGVDNGSVTVKVDTSNELENLYTLARRAKSDNNSENAAKYYEMITLKDPNSWEACFYLVYFKAMSCKIAEIASAGNSVTNCLESVLTLIRDYVKDRDEQLKAVREVTVSCLNISNLLYKSARDYWGGIDISIRANYNQGLINNCCSARDIDYFLGDNIEKLFPDYEELHTSAWAAWKDGVEKHNTMMPYFAQKETNKAIIEAYVAKIQKYDSSYVGPKIEIPTSKGGCYVATAVYGSYDCPQVWTLRRYRDNTLAKTWYGRAFIHTYYAISPTLVKWFGHTEWFKKMWQGKLDRMVEKLRSEGVEDTPYDDIDW